MCGGIMTFIPSSITLTGQIRLAAPLPRVFPLFSPLGEKLWVPGWNPEILYPPNVEWAEGQLFRTHEELESAIWVVSQLDLKGFQVVYHRVEASRYVAQIVVRCYQATVKVTEVAIVYRFVGLSDKGNQEIDAMSQEAYEEKMAHWNLWLDAHLQNSV
jgi:hypothetical protein